MDDESNPEERRGQFVRAREASELTQQEAAKRLGMSLASVSRKERGEQPVSASDVLAMQSLAEKQNEARRLDMVRRRSSADDDVATLPWPPRTVLRLQSRADAFEWEMIRSGANNEDAGLIRDRVRTFLGALAERMVHDPDGDLETYLVYGLRPWVLKRIEQRQPAHGLRVAEPEQTYLDPDATSTGKREA